MLVQEWEISALHTEMQSPVLSGGLELLLHALATTTRTKAASAQGSSFKRLNSLPSEDSHLTRSKFFVDSAHRRWRDKVHRASRKRPHFDRLVNMMDTCSNLDLG